MTRKRHLFTAIGIELEYMIVRKDDLKVLPISEHLLKNKDGTIGSEIEHGKIAWSNELIMHLIELKTNGPARSLDGLSDLFQRDVRRICRILEAHDAILLPSAMHPTMKPEESIIWPHEYNKVYKTYDRIFSCKGHGWSNLQSTHINLPFADEDEFVRLHEAIRILLPVLPALAASSPIVEGRQTGFADNRMKFYRCNSQSIPSICGGVIPDSVDSIPHYHKAILAKMYSDIAPHDPDKILQHEWLNSRGAISRFERDAIEIRVLDIQECPLADIAIAWMVVEMLKRLVYDGDLKSQQDIKTTELRKIFLTTIKDAETAVIKNKKYLALFGFEEERMPAKEFFRRLIRKLGSQGILRETAAWMIKNGSLSTRIRQSVAKRGLTDTYKKLAGCLLDGRMFVP